MKPDNNGSWIRTIFVIDWLTAAFAQAEARAHADKVA